MRRRNFLELHAGVAIGDALEPAPRTVAGWNALALRAMSTTRPTLAVAAHALALLHTCMYNAWAAYDDDARQTMHGLAVRLPRAERDAASKASAMSHAARLALAERFPSQRELFDAHMAGLGLAPAADAAQFSPAGIGRTPALSMLDYCPRDDAGQLDDGVTAHWCQLAGRIAEREGYDDDREVLLYFVLANALADAVTVALPGLAAAPTFASARLLALHEGDAVDADGAIAAAAAEVLRRFSGSGVQAETTTMAGRELGRKVGALVFDKARGYWQGKL